MRVYTIYHKASDPAVVLGRADETLFIKEGFSWAALFGQIFWLLSHRLWIASAIYLAALIIILVLGGLLGAAWLATLLAILMIGLGFEANDIRGFFLMARDYNIIGITEGSSLGACERQFFTDLEETVQAQPKNPAKQPETSQLVVSPSFSSEEETAIGLFPKPGV